VAAARGPGAGSGPSSSGSGGAGGAAARIDAASGTIRLEYVARAARGAGGGGKDPCEGGGCSGWAGIRRRFTVTVRNLGEEADGLQNMCAAGTKPWREADLPWLVVSC
jgi:hypothetical protein